MKVTIQADFEINVGSVHSEALANLLNEVQKHIRRVVPGAHLFAFRLGSRRDWCYSDDRKPKRKVSKPKQPKQKSKRELMN